MQEQDFFLSNSVWDMFSRFYNREVTVGHVLAFPFYLVFLVIAYPIAVIADIIVFIVYPYSDKGRARWQFGLLVVVAIIMVVWSPIVDFFMKGIVGSIPYMGGRKHK